MPQFIVKVIRKVQIVEYQEQNIFIAADTQNEALNSVVEKYYLGYKPREESWNTVEDRIVDEGVPDVISARPYIDPFEDNITFLPGPY